MYKLDLGFEIKYVIILVIIFLMTVEFTSSHDEHYTLRVRIPKWMNILFFNHVKNETVPMISFLAAVQFYVSFIILSIISFVNGVSLTFLLFKYLFIPYLGVTLILGITDLIIGRRKKSIAEKLSREAYLNKIHSQKKKAKTKRKKRK